MKHNNAGPEPVYWREHPPSTATGVITVGGASWTVQVANAMALYSVGGASPTLFIGDNSGKIHWAQDTVASGVWTVGGQVAGLALATPSLYVSRHLAPHAILKINVNDGVSSPFLTEAEVTSALGGSFQPDGLALDGSNPFLYVGDMAVNRILRVEIP